MKGPASTGVGDRLGSPSGAAGFCLSPHGTHIPPGASGAHPPLSVHGEGCNLPGWPWAMITKVALDRLSRSLHSDVCDSDKCGDAVACSRISGRGNRRLCAVPNYIQTNMCTDYGIWSTHNPRCENSLVALPKHCLVALPKTSVHPIRYEFVGGKDRAKIRKLTLDALNTRQSLVKGERLVRHEMRAVLPDPIPTARGASLRSHRADNR